MGLCCTCCNSKSDVALVASTALESYHHCCSCSCNATAAVGTATALVVIAIVCGAVCQQHVCSISFI